MIEMRWVYRTVGQPMPGWIYITDNQTPPVWQVLQYRTRNPSGEWNEWEDVPFKFTKEKPRQKD